MPIRMPLIEQIAIPVVRQVVNRPAIAKPIFSLHRWGNVMEEGRYSDPYPYLQRIAADGPVTFSRLYQQWFVTGYEEAQQLLVMPSMVSGAQVEMVVRVHPYSKLSPWTKDFLGNLLVLTDDPQHGRLRRLVNKAFTPRQMARLEPMVEQVAGDLLAGVADQNKPDLHSEFNAKLPINMISYLLGVPSERWDWTARISREIVKLLDPFTVFDWVAVDTAILETRDYLIELADERRANPTDDLISALVEVEDEGDRLTEMEFIATVATILVAGHETTTGLLGTSLVALAANPNQRELLRANPGLWPNAIEELIRYDTPVQSLARTTTEETELGGVAIPPGANISVMLAAANRDPRRFGDPDQLILDRQDPRPLAFGHGAHYCLGAALARMELRIGLQAILTDFGDFVIEPDDIAWRRSITLRGPEKLHLARSSN